MVAKRKRAGVATEASAQAALRRGPARQLAADEEKVMRMRLGASLPRGGVLERLGRGHPDAEIELLSYEIEAWLRLGDRAGPPPRPPPATSRVKQKIVRALRKKR